MEDGRQLNTWEGYVNWRNRPVMRDQHGGMIAASFVLVVEILENLAFLANASNLVLYLSKFMHYSPSSSANIVTNFMGTAFLLALLGGFLSDAFFTTYRLYLTSAAIEFVGLLILTVQAHMPSLKPPVCAFTSTEIPCEKANGHKETMLFIGLYLVALGVGGIKGSLPPHGAEQFDDTTPQGRKQRSSFFNYFVFCLSCGGLIAVTFVIWIEDNKGWKWGFGVATVAILTSIPVFLLGSPIYRTKIPAGSPITTMFKVLFAAVYNNCKSKNPNNEVIGMETTTSPSTDSIETGKEESDAQVKVPSQTLTEDLKFLNKAIAEKPVSPMLQCTVKEVEEVKVVLRIIPVFMCTIMLNCCLAQLSTFSVQQAATMNTKIGSLKVPPASLPVFPIIFVMIIAPTYNHVIVPFARKVTKTEMGITHLQRIGTGLILSIVAMAMAALVEIKRKKVAVESGLLDSAEPLPITFLWIALQYLFLGSADLFTLAGMMEFFFTEAPTSMRSLATSLSWASLSMGYYFSSVLISIVKNVTSIVRHTTWLAGSNLNHYHLERFYWLMCVLSGLNFFHYLFWANRYKYRT
ncbi:Protein NRT1/ PTR FAMILY 4.6 [Hibiscus syriacus]|uniref:Protein NRT1/ PTR FAMILY 4.6 n=1 Tax=Hibiscus syriacus TaxID=106335 RepID=A0A6A2YCJ9_HIBSY|nr:protein NRT1/ PTR FAMILY 4.6-like [Hibiscus syriacus]KAE8670777.1 Protein NRT1/ PTR FAMILY 4.6 [Hibiscus syriacus]